MARQLLGNLYILSEPFPLNTYCVAGTMLRARGLIPVNNETVMVLILKRHGQVEQEGQKARAAQEQHDGRRGQRGGVRGRREPEMELRDRKGAQAEMQHVQRTDTKDRDKWRRRWSWQQRVQKEQPWDEKARARRARPPRT